MPRYLFTVQSNVCKCKDRKGRHPYNSNHTLRPCIDCDCNALRLDDHEVEADTIREVAEKLHMKLDDIRYIYKTKL